MFRSIVSLVLVLVLTAQAGAELSSSIPSTKDFFFASTFQDGVNWTKSDHPDYAGQAVEVTEDETLKAPLSEDKGLVLRDGAKKYGVGTAFARPFSLGLGEGDKKTLVFQYEVKLTQGLTCGGAYLKLLRAPFLSAKELNPSSPYSVMFGPDSCGDTNKVHLILQHENPVSKEWEEKHLATRVLPEKGDTASHLYTLVLRADDDTFEVLVDLESKAKGSLLEDFTPAFNPEAEIDDPADFKPEDWVDAKKIKDSAAVKPDDWDEDAPRKVVDTEATKPKGWLDGELPLVADPEAVVPQDWDEEEDGEWEAPIVENSKCAAAPGCGLWSPPTTDNPDYKGKWWAPMIDNPSYVGEWAPKRVANPTFFTDEHPASSLAPILGAAIEVWTMSGGIRFDNVLLVDSEEQAREFALLTWKRKKDMEKAEKKVLSQEERLLKREEKRAEGGLNNMIEVYLADAMDFVAKNQYPVLGTLLALVAALVMLLGPSASTVDGEADGGTAQQTDKAAAEAGARSKRGAAAAAEESAAEEAEAEVAEEDKAAAEAKANKKKKTPKA